MVLLWGAALTLSGVSDAVEQQQAGATRVKQYSNPTQSAQDSPDPGVLYYQGLYYAVTTEGWGGSYAPIWESNDTATWKHIGFAIPKAPAWASCCTFWAPELHVVDGHLNLYYVGKEASSGKLVVGMRSSPSGSIHGPWVDLGSPL